MPSRPSTYPLPDSPSHSDESERATKRRRPASMDPAAVAQMQWATGHAQVADPRYSSRAYPSHSQGHGHAAPGMRPTSTARRSSPSSNTDSRRGSNEPDEEEEEPFDHGPTELPPRGYSGQSKYNQPKKPGKIPGSAMDYVSSSFLLCDYGP